MELAKMQREQELEKVRLEASQKMTAEQILALQAGNSASAASAFAAKAQAETAQHDKLVEEMKRMTAERVAHDELTIRMLHDIASKAVEKPVTVVNGAQSAQPAPINIVK